MCGIGGDIISEVVQGLLPYKTFQTLDVLANLLGSACGLFIARQLARRRRHLRELRELYQPLDEYGLSEESDEDSGVPRGDLEGGRPEMAAVDASQRAGRSAKGPQDVWRDDASSIFSLGEEEPDEEIESPLASPQGPSITIERPSGEGPG